MWEEYLSYDRTREQRFAEIITPFASNICHIELWLLKCQYFVVFVAKFFDKWADNRSLKQKTGHF
jgi:hypothetical protein